MHTPHAPTPTYLPHKQTHTGVFSQLMTPDPFASSHLFAFLFTHSHINKRDSHTPVEGFGHVVPRRCHQFLRYPVMRLKEEPEMAAVSLAVEMWSVIKDGISVRAHMTSCKAVNLSSTQEEAETKGYSVCSEDYKVLNLLKLCLPRGLTHIPRNHSAGGKID